MKIHRLFLSGLALPLLLAFSPRADRVEFHAAKDTELTKTFETSTELSQENMSVSMNGNEIDPSQMGGMEVSATSKERATVTDVYLEVGTGRATKIRRTFDRLDSTNTTHTSNEMMGDMEQDMKGESELQGKAVVFSLAEGDWKVAFDEKSGGDEDLLVDLWSDMDLLALLPGKEVSAGDTWELDVGELRHLLAPGGNMKIVPQMTGDDAGMGGGPQPGMSDMLGDLQAELASATYAGTDTVEGLKVAKIQIKLRKISSAKDMTEFMAGAMEAAELPEGMEMKFESADIEFTIDAEGVLLWNLEAGHIHSLDLSGTMTLDSDMSMETKMMGQSMAMDVTTEMSGSFTRTVRLGPAD